MLGEGSGSVWVCADEGKTHTSTGAQVDSARKERVKEGKVWQGKHGGGGEAGRKIHCEHMHRGRQ